MCWAHIDILNCERGGGVLISVLPAALFLFSFTYFAVCKIEWLHLDGTVAADIDAVWSSFQFNSSRSDVMRHFAHAKCLTICPLWVLTVIYTRSACGHLNVTGALCNSCFVSSCGMDRLTPHHDVCSGRPSALTLWGAIRLHSVSVIFNEWWVGSFHSSHTSKFLHNQWQVEFSQQHHVDRSARLVWSCFEFLFAKKWNSSFFA
jgi:hypothetical protein